MSDGWRSRLLAIAAALLSLVAVETVAEAASAPPVYAVDPKGTWLAVDTAGGDVQVAPTKVSFSRLSLKPGDFIALRRKGGFTLANGRLGTGLIARFYGKLGYLAAGADDRPAEVKTKSTCAPGGTATKTDVKGDFAVSGSTWVLAQIPAGAVGIAFSPNTCFFKDNATRRGGFGAEMVPAYQKTVLSGPASGPAVDITILADGFTYEQRDAFAAAAESFRTKLVSIEPFKSNAAKLRFVRVMSPSQKSGARANIDDPLDIFYQSYFFCDGVTDRLLCSDGLLVSKAVRRVTKAGEREIVLVLVNSATYGGSGGVFAVSSLNAAADRIAVHELGHSFGRLDDEYDYGGGCDSRTPWGFNVTSTLVRADIPWTSFIAGSTPLPTTAPARTSAPTRGRSIAPRAGTGRPTARSCATSAIPSCSRR